MKQGAKKPGKRDALARVRTLAKELPDVVEGTTFGWPAFKHRGKLFAWFPVKAEVEPGTLAVRMSIFEREQRIAAQPDLYYVTPHYKDYPSVLARPDRMTDTALRELLESAHEFMVSDEKRRKATRKR
jgi:hypothetical protein